jgi:hypothetical protein
MDPGGRAPNQGTKGLGRVHIPGKVPPDKAAGGPLSNATCRRARPRRPAHPHFIEE